jgi:hypothetical protein
MQLFESFRATRWIRTLNLVLQALLFTTLCAGLNYLALHYSWRTDLTHARRYSLSPETLSYLQRPRAPRAGGRDAHRECRRTALAQALHRRAGTSCANTPMLRKANESGGQIKIKQLDVYQQRRDAEQLSLDQPNAILFLCGEQRRVVTLGELYRIIHHDR